MRIERLLAVERSWWPVFLVVNTVLFNEYLIYFLKISTTCSWKCPKEGCKSSHLRSFMISDTHILGTFNGHWFDKLKREWQMHRAYRTAITLFPPDAVFFLGDLIDEGIWTSEEMFADYARQFREIFGVPAGSGMLQFAVAGNHDLGFHYAIHPQRVKWFKEIFNRSSVDLVQVKGYPFILITSMALHGDGCRLCYEAEKRIRILAKRFECASRDGGVQEKECEGAEIDKLRRPFRKPILLQHFPLYRKTDEDCYETEEDAGKKAKMRPQWEALSEESTNFLISSLKPRAVFGGHTHRSCKKEWRYPESFTEYTVNSFSWRNGDSPTFLLVTITPEEVLVSTCHLPQESTTFVIYAFSIITILIWVFYKAKSFFYSRRYLPLKNSNKFK